MHVVQSCWASAATPLRPGGERWGRWPLEGCIPVALSPRRCTLSSSLWCLTCRGVPVRLEMTQRGSSLST